MKHLPKVWIFIVIAPFQLMGAEEDLEFSNVDVAKLATHTYGTGK